MSSNESGDMDVESPMSAIILDLDQFKALFQVTYQASNFQPPRLAEQGVDPADLDQMMAVISSIRDVQESASKVRIIYSAEEMKAAAPTRVSLVEVGEGGGSVEVQAILPQHFLTLWRVLLEFVTSSLGSREIFLRTGYGSEEIRDAVDALSG